MLDFSFSGDVLGDRISLTDKSSIVWVKDAREVIYTRCNVYNLPVIISWEEMEKYITDNTIVSNGNPVHYLSYHFIERKKKIILDKIKQIYLD